MLTTPLTESQIKAYNANGGAQAKNADPAAMQDRFMKLLVTQINNQDPLNPMDNAELTSQMAQINTVSGIQQLNVSLQSMAAQIGTLQNLQGTTLVGRDVVSAGNQMEFDGNVAQGSLSLPSTADSVVVQVLGTGGQVLDQLPLGALPAGMHNFSWDATGHSATEVKGFKVVALSDGKAVDAQPLARQRVESVGMVDGVMRLRTNAGNTLSYDQVLAFM